MNKQILFVGHSAERTGAPVLFLSLLRWFKENVDIPFEILIKSGGELEPELNSLAPVTVLSKKASGVKRLLKAGTRRLGLTPIGPSSIVARVHRGMLKRQYAQGNIGLIYSNTATNGVVLDALSYLNCPVISHVHELEYCIRYQIGLDSFDLVNHHTTHYIAVSEAVKRNLIQSHAIPEKKIDVVHGFVSTRLHNLTNQPKVRYQIREQLGIPQGALIVGAAGDTKWFKGPDLFIQLARLVCRRKLETPVHFVWIGGDTEGPSFAELWHDTKNLGLEEYVHFIGARTNPLDYFTAFDVFALVSRTDSFPLVMLEAALVGKPTICFDGAGGAKEFVEDDCGYVVPYLDVDMFGGRVVELLQCADLRQRLGQRAKQKVQEQHDVAVVAPKIVGIIRRFF